MNYDKLKPKATELLAANPDWTDQQVADALNAATATVTRSRFVTYRTLLSELPIAQAMSIIGKIKAAPDPMGVLAVIRPTLENTAEGTGIDMANANARAFVDGLVTAKVLSAEEAAAIKGLAETQVSWASQNGFGQIRAAHIRNVRDPSSAVVEADK
jgi:hypothetical protein